MADTNEPQAERTDTNPKDTAAFWQTQLGLADKDQQDWEKDGKAVVDRYRAEKKRSKEARWFNILFSNTETLKSTLYGKTAKPDVRRRFADKDPAARQAAEVIERSLIYCAEAYDVDKCIKPALHDYLLPGRGVVRVEYEPIIKERPKIDPMTAQPVMTDGKPEMEEFVADQVCRERYVYWQDYRQAPARIFDGDVWWAAFRHIMTRQDLRDNKFENVKDIPLNWSPDTDNKQPVPDELKRAEVWEIWDKSQRKRIWIVKSFDKPLRIDDDPYGLEDFFPFPEPIRSVEDTETLVPRPEYHEYRDQAEDLDEIVGRISKLTRALKRRGVYNKAIAELKRLSTANDNQFIPVDNYEALVTKGGLAGQFQSEDISMIALVLKELYIQRDMLVQSIYELTGIADIMRGSSDPNETLGAQQLKAQFGSTRIKRRQRAVQKWIRDLYKLKAEIIAEHFEPQVLKEMTGIEVTPEVLQILRSDKLRGYRIDIETDSTVFEDDAAVKQQTTEALTAIGGFFREALPAVQQAPELAPLAFEMVGMAARNLKKGRELEDIIEQTKNAIMEKVAAAKNQPPPVDPKVQAEAAKAQQAMQQADQKHQQDMAKGAQEMEFARELHGQKMAEAAADQAMKAEDRAAAAEDRAAAREDRQFEMFDGGEEREAKREERQFTSQAAREKHEREMAAIEASTQAEERRGAVKDQQSNLQHAQTMEAGERGEQREELKFKREEKSAEREALKKTVEKPEKFDLSGVEKKIDALASTIDKRLDKLEASKPKASRMIRDKEGRLEAIVNE